MAIPSQAVAAEAEPASGEPHDAEGSDPLDDTAAAAGEAVNPAEPDDVWESGAAEQPVPEVSGTVEAEAEPAEAPVDARAAETTRGLETIPAKPGTIEAVHDSKPADGNDEVQGLTDATDRMASERAAVEAATQTMQGRPARKRPPRQSTSSMRPANRRGSRRRTGPGGLAKPLPGPPRRLPSIARQRRSASSGRPMQTGALPPFPRSSLPPSGRRPQR